MRRRTESEGSFRHRDKLYEHWRAQIMREATSLDALASVESRALGDRDVRADAELGAMVQRYVAQCRAQLLHERVQRDRELKSRAPVPHRPSQPNVLSDALRKENAERQLARLEAELHDHVVHLHEQQAHTALARLKQLQNDHPDIVSTDRIAACEQRVARLGERIVRFRDHIEQRRAQAREATIRGDQRKAVSALRHLSAIHGSHPQLLPEERLERIRQDIIEASEQQEHQTAARALVEKERAVAHEIRRLAQTVRRFHQIARQEPHDAPEFLKARKAYEQAVRDIRAHDERWLVELVLELADLLAEWGHPPESARRHVDHFLDSVRKALNTLRGEVEKPLRPTDPL